MLIADLVAPASERERRYMAQRWDAEVTRQSLALTGSDTIYRAFVDGHSNWYTYPDPVDMPSTVAEHIAWLTEARSSLLQSQWATRLRLKVRLLYWG